MKMIYVAALILVFAVLAIGMALILKKPAGPSAAPTRDAAVAPAAAGGRAVIADALNRLKEMPQDSGPFLILTDDATGSFVQFTGPHLYADRFVEGLPNDQRQAIVSFLERWPNLTVHESTHYQIEFGTDVAAATDFAVKMFDEVFGVLELKDLTINFDNFY